MAERGEVMLGGCVIDASSPQWACTACGESFGQRLTREQWEALGLAPLGIADRLGQRDDLLSLSARYEEHAIIVAEDLIVAGH